jgi:hypothetical protein
LTELRVAEGKYILADVRPTILTFEISSCDLIVGEMATVPTRFIYMSTKNVRTDGLPGDPQNDVAGSYTLMLVNDYSPDDPLVLATGGPARRAVDLKTLRTGDQKM